MMGASFYLTVLQTHLIKNLFQIPNLKTFYEKAIPFQLYKRYAVIFLYSSS
jgi:hypothetical protein